MSNDSGSLNVLHTDHFKGDGVPIFLALGAQILISKLIENHDGPAIFRMKKHKKM